MLDGAQLVAFVATSDLDRATAFYGDTLGLKLIERTGFASVFDAGGTTLRVTLVEQVTPAPHTVLGWQVEDLATQSRALAMLGVQPERFAGMVQDDSGAWTSPSGDRVLWFKDPDNNLLSLTARASTVR